MSNLISVYVATLFVVAGASVIVCSPFGGKDIPLVNEICEITKHPSKRLSTVAELNELVGQINNNKVECPDRIKSSIHDLNNLIREHQQDVCSQESANDIADYYSKYLASKDPENSNSLIEFPKALKKFFISYGLKVSNFCRTQMADRLIGDGETLIGTADIQEVADFTGQKRCIAAFMGDPSEKSSHKQLAFPKNFIKMMKSFESFNLSNQQKLLLQVSTTNRVHRIQSVCQQRFRPIYKDLILPLVTLAEVGFNYDNGEDSRLEPNVIKQVYEWYRIVFLCEAMNKVEFFQSPEDQEKATESNRRLVRILDREEADKLRSEQSAIMNSADVEFKQIEYIPELKSMPLDVNLYDNKDSKLEKAIMAFRKRTRNENEPDVAHKMAKFVEDKINRGSIKIMGKLTGIKNLPADGQLTGMDIVKLLDQYEHSVETGNSKAISQSAVFLGETNWPLLGKIFLVVAVVAFLLTVIGLAG